MCHITNHENVRGCGGTGLLEDLLVIHKDYGVASRHGRNAADYTKWTHFLIQQTFATLIFGRGANMRPTFLGKSQGSMLNTL